MEKVTIKLTSPINAHGQEVSSLELRAPKVPEIRALGMPFAFTASGSTEMNMEVVARYIAKLASIPSGSVDQLSIQDFSELMGAVLGFFGNAPGETSTN